MSYQRSIGPIGLMFTAVSGIMGSAWLFGPYYVAKIAGPSAMVAWIVGALAMLIIAMTFAEICTMFPITGGNARFSHFTHGSMTSFLFSWIMWLGYAAVAPVETMGVLQYLSSHMPYLISTRDHVSVLTVDGYIFAAILLLLLCWLNFFSIKWLARYNSVIVWVKVIVPILVAVCIMSLVFHAKNYTQFGGFAPFGWQGVTGALSLGGVIFSFAGYAPVIVLAGEAKNPQKVIPLVLFGALGLCLAIYLLLQNAFIGAQASERLMHGWSHLDFPMEASPFIAMARQLHLNWLEYLILVTAVIAPLGTALIFIATSSRVASAMSENGYFPQVFSRLSSRGVPTIAVCLNFVVGMVLFFPSPGWQGMVGFLVSAFVLCYLVGPVCVMSMRCGLPNQPRPFRLPFASLWCYAAFLVASLIVYWTGWAIDIKMLIAILIGVVVWFVCRACQSNLSQDVADIQWHRAVWLIVYLIGMGVIAFLGNYGGGKGFLPLGWDILVVAVFAVIIYLWSIKSALPSAAIQQRLPSTLS